VTLYTSTHRRRTQQFHGTRSLTLNANAESTQHFTKTK